jgi:hypothetical protein
MYYLMIIKLQKAAKAYCLWFKGKNLIQNFGPISFYQILEGRRVIILNSNLRLINYMIFFKYIDFFSNIRESIN